MTKRFFIRHFFFNLVRFLCVILLVTVIIVAAVIYTMVHDIRDRMERNLETSSNTISLLLDNGNIQNALMTFESSVSSTIRDVLENNRLTYKDIPIRDLLKYTVYSPTILSRHIESVYLYMPNSKQNFLSSSALIQNLNTTVDPSWYNDYITGPSDANVWVKSRIEGHYDFETPRRIISVYQRLNFSDGVLVFNILPESLAESIRVQALHQDEIALLFNSAGELLLTTDETASETPNYEQLSGISNDGSITSYEVNDHSWFVARQELPQYGLTYFLLSSQDTVFQSVQRILLLCMAAVLIAVLSSVLLSLTATRRNARRVQAVIDLFTLAEQGKPIPPLVQPDRDEYDLITNNIIKTFLRHSYLDLQLKNRHQEAKIAQLTALQLQINPHFLFNTLQIIDFEVLKANQKYSEANQLIQHLSNILMYSLHNTDRPVTLGEEIERTRDYLYIQQYRYPVGPLLPEWDCDPNISDIPCMCMILQPFLENSITHGWRENNAPLRIRISIRHVHSQHAVHIRIVDNGCGINRTLLNQLRDRIANQNSAESGQHIGICNTVTRLQLFCGERLRFHIHSIAGIGTMIDFEIPTDI